MVRVRQARRKGVREEPASERPSSQTTGSNLVDLGRAAARTRRIGAGNSRAGHVAGREATVNACGVVVAMPQGHSWAPTPSNGSGVNVGTIPAVPSPAGSQVGRREGPSSADAAGMGRRARSSPRPGKPATWRRGPAGSQQQCR